MKSSRLLSLSLTAALIAALPVAARAAPASQSGKRIERILHRLGEVERPRNVAISPDGMRLAFTVHGKQGDRVAVANIDGTHLRRVALDKTFKRCKARGVQWSPDGRRLAFLSDCGSGKDNRAQRDIYLVDATAANLTARRLSHLNGYAQALRWAPDGRHLGILYIKGDTHQSGATHATKERVGVIGAHGVQHQQMASVDAASGKVETITPHGLFVYEYSWSPDGGRLAYVAAPPPGANNWWVAKLYVQPARAGAEARAILDPKTTTGSSLHGLQIALPRFSRDGSRIAFISGLMSDQGATSGDIYLIDADGGKPVDITPGIHISPSWLTWTAADRLLVASIAGGSTRVSTFALNGKHAATETPLFTVDAAIGDGSAASALAVSAKHDVLAVTHSTFTRPPEIAVARLRTNGEGQPTGIAKPLHAVTHFNAGVKPMWDKAVSVDWINEGYRVQGWLLFPAGYQPGKTYPMIVNVHGGPSWAVRPRWPRVGYGAVPLSALGYFVLMPNPRGSKGQGEKFAQAVRRDMGYGDLRDILAGVDAVEKKYPVDDNRLGLTGWSYGGFMSMFVPTQTQRFKAVVAGAGISDWKSYYGQNSIDQWMIPFFSASVYEIPKVYAKSSAVNFIQQQTAPTLIVVGERDAECPAPQSFEYWHALRAMGVPTQLIVYKDEGHHFMQPEHRRDVLERALAWFQKYLATS